MKNTVKNPQSQTTEPNIKINRRASVQKEYYILRDDVFEFIGIFTEATLPKLNLMQEPA